jgi:cytochrome c oxidase cbb3-type subunit 3/ubiquinol-cytochrome c reductase cytochrome c subunit
MGAYGKARQGPLSDRDVRDIVAFLRAGGPAPETLSGNPIVGDAAAGKKIYETGCQSCHGTETTRGTAPHLANQMFLAAATDAFIKEAIVRGRPGTPMEAFAGKLDDAAINNVVAYVRAWAKPIVAPDPPPEPPPVDGPVVINPKGKAPEFKLRDDRFVGVDQVKAAMDDGRRMIIVDARTPADWQRGRVTGAISAPYYELGKLDAIPDDGTWVIAYCACPHHASGIVVDELKKRGYKHAAVLDEGINVWKQKGYPVEGTDPHGDPHAGHKH